MSIETEINRISTNVSNTLSAISEMGGGVPEGATSNNMAAGVRSIPVGAKIDDTTPSTSTTYSSSKIESKLTALNDANAALIEVSKTEPNTENTELWIHPNADEIHLPQINDSMESDQDTWSSKKIAAEVSNKANEKDLAPVAKSGSYTDLTNKPTIPTVPSTLPNPNKLTFTGAVTAEYDGSEAVSVEIPAGGSGGYTLPIASATQLGGVMPAAKTDEMTQAVGVDADGKLWALPGGSIAKETRMVEIVNHTVTEDEAASASRISFTSDEYPDMLKIVGMVWILTSSSEGSSMWRAAYFNGKSVGNTGTKKYVFSTFSRHAGRVRHSYNQSDNANLTVSVNEGFVFLGSSIASGAAETLLSPNGYNALVDLPYTSIGIGSYGSGFIAAGSVIRVFGEVEM